MLDSTIMPCPTRPTRFMPVLTLTIALLFFVSCSDVAAPDAEKDQQDIEARIREYLPLLGQAYATGNIERLKELTVEKELSRINLRVSELADLGQVYEPEFKEMTVENISIWQYANAVATTLEVWDVRSYALGSRDLISEVTGQRNRVKYQLKRKDHGWVVLYRELEEALGS